MPRPGKAFSSGRLLLALGPSCSPGASGKTWRYRPRADEGDLELDLEWDDAVGPSVHPSVRPSVRREEGRLVRRNVGPSDVDGRDVDV